MNAGTFVLAAALVLLAGGASRAATTETVGVEVAAPQNLRIEATAAKTEYRIGDQIEYDIKVEWKSPIELVRVEPSAALGVFEIVRPPDVKQKKIGRGWRQEQTRYILSTFETGEFTIPEFTIIYRDADGNEQRIPTPQTKITVQSVAPVRPDETGIRDAKPPVVPPFRLSPRQKMIIAAAAFLLLVAAVVLVVRAMRKRRAQPAPAIPPRPIEVVAREQLARIAQSDLLARGLIKEYFDQVSDIIRAYLGYRYGFEGIVTTTSELLNELHERLHDDGHIGLVAEFSEEADLAKFAKWRPDRQVCDRFLETAYRLIDETTPRPVAEDRQFQVSGSRFQDEENREATGDVEKT